jgi:hypothetical protein
MSLNSIMSEILLEYRTSNIDNKIKTFCPFKFYPSAKLPAVNLEGKISPLYCPFAILGTLITG